MNQNEMNQNEEMEIDLGELFSMLKSHYKAIIICVLLGALVMGLVTVFLMDRKYEAVARIYPKPEVSDGAIDNTQINANNQMVNNYVEMIKGNNIQNQVATALGISFSEVNSSISVSNVSNTQIIRIGATTTDPELSKQIVDQVVTTFTTEASETLNINNIAVIDEATVPTSPVSPNLNMNIIIGALIGGVVSVGYIFIRFMMDTRIHNKEEAEKYLDIPCLGSIPYFD